MGRLAVAQRSNSQAPLTDQEIWRSGQRVIAIEARALAELIGRLDQEFVEAAKLIADLDGSLIVTGMGKAGLIGQKLAATFASTGTRAHFLHPAEAVHGDLGRLHASDVVLALSQSGATAELLQLLPALRAAGIPLVAITATKQNALALAARFVLPIGQLEEACALGLAPSTSTTAMLALGDALALVVSQLRGFRAEDFARFHPGGSLGQRLSRVEEKMRPLSQCRVAHEAGTIREAVIASTRPGRRSGAIMLTDDEGKLTGLFTDSDLARLIERRKDDALDRPVAEVMATSPTTVCAGSLMTVALDLLAERKFSELPVVDDQGRPLGMIDVTDVLDASSEPSANHAGTRSPSPKVRPNAPRTVHGEPPTVRIFPTAEA